MEGILRELGEARMEIRHRAYELYPAPADLPPVAVDARDWSELQRLAAHGGFPLERPAFRPRTRKAHEAARFARERGVEREMRSAIFMAYWRDALDIGRIDSLVSAGKSVGLDPEELKIVLDIDSYEQVVLEDEELGRRLRIPGTPVLYLGAGRTATVVIGARPAPELEAMVKQAEERAENRDNV